VNKVTHRLKTANFCSWFYAEFPGDLSLNVACLSVPPVH